MTRLKKFSPFSILIGASFLTACLESNTPSSNLKNVKSGVTLCEGTTLEKWEGYGGGMGTFTDPYLICTPEQFQAIRGDMMEKRYFKITQDLDFSDSTYPWGIRPTPIGVIDGGNHKLNNITIDYHHGVVGTGIYNRLVKDLNGNRDEIRNLII